MAEKLIILPEATLHRLYALARRRHMSPDRVIEDLIDDASRGLTIEEWEQAHANGQARDGVEWGMQRFHRRLHEVQGQSGDV